MTGRSSVKQQECGESFTAEKYILDELSEEERDAFEAHFFECADCAEAVRDLSELREGMRAGLCKAPEAASARSPAPSWMESLRAWWLRPQALAAGALALVCITAVTSYQNVQLKHQLRPQVVPSLLLQPATRGELPALQLNQSAPFVLLETDLPGASGNLVWQLHTSEGSAVLTGMGAAPQPGLSFKVLLPVSDLREGEYGLTVRSDAGREWQFRFRTGPR